MVFNPAVFNFPVFNTGGTPDITPTGQPTFPWTLFRGMVIGKDIERQGELLRLTLDLEDYNRLGPKIKVGAPVFGIFIHQEDPPPDGTDVAIDADAQTTGVTPTSEIYRLKFIHYWAGRGVTFDDTTYVDTVNGAGVFADYATALTDWKSFSDDFLRYMGPYAKAWIDPDLNLHVTRLAAVGDISDYARPAPYALDDDGVLGIMPMKMSVKWDYSTWPYRIFLRGGTPPAGRGSAPGGRG